MSVDLTIDHTLHMETWLENNAFCNISLLTFLFIQGNCTFHDYIITADGTSLLRPIIKLSNDTSFIFYTSVTKIYHPSKLSCRIFCEGFIMCQCLRLLAWLISIYSKLYIILYMPRVYSHTLYKKKKKINKAFKAIFWQFKTYKKKTQMFFSLPSSRMLTKTCISMGYLNPLSAGGLTSGEFQWKDDPIYRVEDGEVQYRDYRIV